MKCDAVIGNGPLMLRLLSLLLFWQLVTMTTIQCGWLYQERQIWCDYMLAIRKKIRFWMDSQTFGFLFPALSCSERHSFRFIQSCFQIQRSAQSDPLLTPNSFSTMLYRSYWPPAPFVSTEAQRREKQHTNLNIWLQSDGGRFATW